MFKPSNKTILAACLAVALGGTAIASAAAQDAPPPPPRPASTDAQRPGGPEGPGGPRGPGWHMRHHRHDHGPRSGAPLWKIAGKLAAAETALGITPEQKPAWDAFTKASVALVTAMRPMHGPMAAMTPPDEDAGDAEMPDADSPDTAAPSGDNDAPQAIGRLGGMLDHMAGLGDAARNARSALDGLTAQLTPEQKQIAGELLREARPHHPPFGGGKRWGHPGRGIDGRDRGPGRD